MNAKFNDGVIYCVWLLLCHHQEEQYAKWILQETGMTKADAIRAIKRNGVGETEMMEFLEEEKVFK